MKKGLKNGSPFWGLSNWKDGVAFSQMGRLREVHAYDMAGRGRT